jgi:glycerophosphoryl diester phosphodiesterase
VAGRTLRLAHRGDWRVAPENSLDAMRAAMAIAACDGLEFDVRRSSDGVPVVIHDDTLQRVQGRPEAVADLTAMALGSLGVPTLAAVLEAADRRAFLYVELKTVPGPEIIEILAAGRGPQLTGAVISSFDLPALVKIGRLAPSWPRWLNSESLDPAVIERATDLACVGIATWWESIDAETMELARAVGLEVAAYTVRDRATFDRLANLGVSAVCVEDEALDG